MIISPSSLRRLLVAVSTFMGFVSSLQANLTINFETEPFLPAQPSTFALAGPTQTYTNPAFYTISGGVVLGNPAFLPAFTLQGTGPNLYMTSDFGDPSLLQTLTLDLQLAQGVTNVQGVLFNGQPIVESYTVTAFSGAVPVSSQTFSIAITSSPTAFANFNLSSVTPITRVTITTPNAATNGWDFGVDTIVLTTIPEPSALGLIGSGMALLGWSGWRRRRQQNGVRRSKERAAVRKISRVVALMLSCAFTAGHSLIAAWLPQGPGPLLNGQSEGITSVQGNNPVSGAIQAVAPLATDVNTIYVATANGGVWKTTNATAATPTWAVLTDQALPNLSLNSIAISPLNSSVIFAGAGLVSSLGGDGGPPFGIGRSTDGGATWTVVGTSLAGKNIRSIVPTTALMGGNQVVLAAVSDGVYRSTDGGVTYTRITNGIPTGSVSDLVGDPGVATRFYAAISGTVYISNDSGASWATATGVGFVVVPGSRVLLSVHNSGALDVAYAMVIASGTLNNVYRSADQGANWTALSVPSPTIFPGGQGGTHGAIVADRTDANTVYISGDRQNSPFPNVNGASNFSANVFRNVSGAWQNMVMNGNGGGSNGTSPHADSRAMVFDANGDIVHVNDGGVYKLVNPNGTTNPGNTGTRKWISLNGNITPTEAHSAAYDSLSQIVTSGNQDAGTGYQLASGGAVWNSLITGDGGNVAVDADQTAHPGTSIRYGSFQNFQFFNRTTWTAANAMVGGFATVSLNIVSGPGTGMTLSAFDGANIQFYTSYALNRIDSSRMIIGTKSIYESFNKGDSLNNLGSTGSFIGSSFANNPISYGGKNPNGTPNPGAFFVGAGSTLFHRTADAAALITVPAYPGGTIRAVVMDPQNVTHVFVLDTSSRVFGSFDDGATWITLTANLATLTTSARTLELFSPDATPRNTVLVAGGQGGAWQMRRPDAAGTSWTVLSSGLPKTLVYDLRYDYTNNVLSAGTVGRGVWTLSAFFRGGGGTGFRPLPSAKDVEPVVFPDLPLYPPSVAAPAEPSKSSK